MCRNQRDSRVSGNIESPSLSLEEAMEERMNAKELSGKVENGESNIELVYTDKPKKAKQNLYHEESWNRRSPSISTRRVLGDPSSRAGSPQRRVRSKAVPVVSVA